MKWTALLLLPLLSACATSPPTNPDNLCAVFREKKRWYDAAAEARDEWGTPIAVMMAIMYQESAFAAKAKPPRRRILWIIPGPRKSDAYGYSQALESTWQEYRHNAGRYGADRDDFGDAIDFIGWYTSHSKYRSGIAPGDAYGQYLAYHEGHGGYSRGTYRGKKWLQRAAARVRDRAARYREQLLGCEKDLKSRGWWPWS